jgi:menaquinone-dependent protoporphyrinogen oxidase
METLIKLKRIVCLAVALTAAASMFAVSANAHPRTASDNITQSCGLEKTSQTILIAYDTIHGSTAEVAARIGEDLCSMGFKVDVKWAGDVTAVDGYDGCIVASALYEFTWLPDALAFLEKFKDTLALMPTAVFIVGASMSKDTPETRAAVQKTFVQPVLDRYPGIKPLSIGLFGGAVDFTKEDYTLFEKIVLHILGFILGYWDKADWRNWQTIDAWAAEVGGKMQ